MAARSPSVAPLPDADAPATPSTIEIDGIEGPVPVPQNFRSLSPVEQGAIVDLIVAARRGAQTPPEQSRTAGAGVFRSVDNVVRAIASGVTFGWADEFAAKMDELTGRGGSYQQNVAQERARDAEIPIALKIPGEIAGAVGGTVAIMPLGAVRAIAAMTSGLPQWVRFGALGAAEGGLAGAGGSTEGNRGMGALAGAAIGAPIGAAAPAVVRGVESTINAVRGAFRPSSGAAADIGRAIVRDADTPAAIEARAAAMQAERPGQVTIADVGGENVRGLIERVAQTPGAGRTTVVPALTNRQEQQLTRIASDLQELTGTNRTAVETLTETMASRQAAATPLYERAYQAGDRTIWSPTLERLSGSPTVQTAMRGAVRKWQDNAIADGFGAMNPGARVAAGGQLEFMSGRVPVFPNVQFWDYTKRIVDDMRDAALRAGQDHKARTFGTLARVLRTELDNIVPEYAAARQSWAGPSAFMASIQDGRNILSRNISAEELRQTFRAFTGAEQEGFRIGAVSSIIGRMGNDPARLADMTKFLRSPEMRAKIAAIMPTPEAAQQWARRLNFEVGSSELVARSLGNSATARRMAEMQQARGVVGDLVMDALMSGPTSHSFIRQILTAGPRWLRDTLRSRTDANLADLLTNPARIGDLGPVLQRASQAQRQQTGRPRAGAAATSSGVNTTVE